MLVQPSTSLSPDFLLVLATKFLDHNKYNFTVYNTKIDHIWLSVSLKGSPFALILKAEHNLETGLLRKKMLMFKL